MRGVHDATGETLKRLALAAMPGAPFNRFLGQYHDHAWQVLLHGAAGNGLSPSAAAS